MCVDRHPYVIEGRKTGQAEPDSETPSPVDDDIIIETPKDGSGSLHFTVHVEGITLLMMS